MAPAPSSSPITCHVLNTLSGKPAANLQAKLTLIAPVPTPAGGGGGGGGATSESASFTATTNADGRIAQWTPATSSTTPQSVQSVLSNFTGGATDKVAWSLTFDVGPWYEAQGVESFWPQVVVSFYVKPGDNSHYHVPVLVGPWTYTTYRGS